MKRSREKKGIDKEEREAFNKEVGAFIKNLRETKSGYKMTQDEFASALFREGISVDRSAVSQWENGYQAPELYTFWKICNLFYISLPFDEAGDAYSATDIFDQW